MRIIQRHHPEIHRHIFAWADTRERMATQRLCGYRLDANLNVTPIWSEMKHA
jgi:hypothetical protein